MTAPTITTSRETDGRWIAEVEAMPGVLAYGDTEEQAVANVRKLAAEVEAETAACKGEP